MNKADLLKIIEELRAARHEENAALAKGLVDSMLKGLVDQLKTRALCATTTVYEWRLSADHAKDEDLVAATLLDLESRGFIVSREMVRDGERRLSCIMVCWQQDISVVNKAEVSS